MTIAKLRNRMENIVETMIMTRSTAVRFENTLAVLTNSEPRSRNVGKGEIAGIRNARTREIAEKAISSKCPEYVSKAFLSTFAIQLTWV
jgi:hypothetical protein